MGSFAFSVSHPESRRPTGWSLSPQRLAYFTGRGILAAYFAGGRICSAPGGPSSKSSTNVSKSLADASNASGRFQ